MVFFWFPTCPGGRGGETMGRTMFAAGAPVIVVYPTIQISNKHQFRFSILFSKLRPNHPDCWWSPLAGGGKQEKRSQHCWLNLSTDWLLDNMVTVARLWESTYSILYFYAYSNVMCCPKEKRWKYKSFINEGQFWSLWKWSWRWNSQPFSLEMKKSKGWDFSGKPRHTLIPDTWSLISRK